MTAIDDRRRPHALIVTASLAVIVAGLGIAAAQAAPDLSPGGVEMESHANAPAVPVVPGDIDATSATEPDSESGENGEWVIAPLPARNPLLGWMVTVPVMRIYRPEASDPDDRAWSTGIAGLYAENDSWGYGAFHDMSFGGDKWRLLFAGFKADLTYDYYGIGGGGDSKSIPISQPVEFVAARFLRESVPDLYVGIEATLLSSDISLDLPDDLLPPGIELPNVDLTVNTLTPTLQYDTRDSQFYPTEGLYALAKVAVGREGLGSDLDYEKYSIEANHYLSLSDASVLASRIAVYYAAGDAPFFVYPAFGSGADLRGYQTGTYRDRFLLAAQTEYRRRLTNRFGAVAFAGIGTVAPDFGEWNYTLGSIGAGLRYPLGRQNDINLRFDVAKGRDDTMWYLGLREAF
jgi:hypothetical protein